MRKEDTLLRQKKTLLMIGLFLGIALYIAITVWSPNFFLYLLFLIFLGIIFIPFLTRKKPIDWFESIYLYSVFYLVTFGLRAIYLVWFPDIEGRPPVDIMGILNTAVIYAIIGYLAFIIGYSLPLAPKLVQYLPKLSSLSVGRIRGIIYFIYPFGLAARLLLLAKGWHLSYQAGEFSADIPPYVAMVAYTYNISLFCFGLALLLLPSQQKRSGLTFYFWFLMLPFEALWVLLVGSKHSFFPLLFLPCAAWNYAKSSFKPRYLVIPLLIFIFCVFPFINAYRNVVNYGDLKLSTFVPDLINVGNKTWRELKDNIAQNYFGNSFGLFMERFNGIDSLSYVILNTPEPVEFQRGRTIIGALAIFVPKFIWPAKEEYLAKSMSLVPMLFGGQFGSLAGGIGITLPAEFYWNFQLPGIILGMIFIGIFNRLFYLYFCRPGNTFSTCMYISQLSFLIFVEGWLYHTYQNIIKQTIIFLCLLAFFTAGHIFPRKTS